MSRLVLATEAQKVDRDRIAHAEWGQRLTVAQFGAREHRLRSHPWATAPAGGAAGAMRTWLWLDDHRRVVASCESFTSPSRLDGRDGVSHAIASVLTDPAARGRGHAAALMEALVAALPQHEPRSHAVTLYSDVGAPLYARSGFVPLPADDLVLAALPGDPSEGVTPLVDTSGISIHWPAERFSFALTGPQLDWHLERERFYAATLGRPVAPLHGASSGGVCAWWIADHKSSRLRILAIDDAAGDAEGSAASGAAGGAGHPDGLAAVVRAARRTAHAVGLDSVDVWLDDSATSARLLALGEGERRERDGSLAMIRPLVAGLEPAWWRVRPRGLWV